MTVKTSNWLVCFRRSFPSHFHYFIWLWFYSYINEFCLGQVHIRICYVWHDNSTVTTMRIMPISIWPIYDRCVRRKLNRIAIHYFLFEGVWIPRSEMSIGEAEILGASSGNAVDVWYYDIILVKHVTVHVMMHNNLSDPESNIYIYIEHKFYTEISWISACF